VRTAATGAAGVEDADPKPGLQQFDRGGEADDAGADDQDIGAINAGGHRRRARGGRRAAGSG